MKKNRGENSFHSNFPLLASFNSFFISDALHTEKIGKSMFMLNSTLLLI